MKKIFFLVLVIPFIIYPQTFTSLMGFEDSLGHTQLFYRLGTNLQHVYHFDISNGTDTLFFYLPAYDQYINDFDFWNNNPSLHIRIWGSWRFTGSTGIYKYNGSSFGGDPYNFQQIDISKQDTNLLYSGGHYYEHLPIPVDFNFVLKSTDAGDTWSITDTNKYFVSLNPFDDTQFFVLDDSTKLFKTTDAGLTFIEVDTTRNNESYWEMLLKFFYDKDSIHIYRSSKDEIGYYLSMSDAKGDSGSWQIIYRKNSLIHIATDNSISGSVYLADGENLYYSTDYGLNFSLNRTFNDTLVGLYKKPNSDTLYAATRYSIYEVTSSSVIEIKNVVSVDDEFSIPTEYKLSQNYPNPFNPTTTIKIVIPKSSFVNLKVYDILGREVATLVNEEKPVGSYDVEFDGSELSSGIYFYKLQAENHSSLKKMILLK